MLLGVFLREVCCVRGDRWMLLVNAFACFLLSARWVTEGLNVEEVIRAWRRPPLIPASGATGMRRHIIPLLQIKLSDRRERWDVECQGPGVDGV